MKLSEDDIELIEKYFSESLSEEEYQYLKERELQSTLFTEEKELQSTMIAALRHKQKTLLKERLKEKAETIDFEKRPDRKINWKLMTIAASISLILLIQALFSIYPTYNRLFEDSFASFPAEPIARGELQNDDYYLAMEAYSRGDFRTAVDRFKRLEEYETGEKLFLYTGNCFLELNQPELAIQELDKILLSEHVLLKTHARWYLSLAYLKTMQSKC